MSDFARIATAHLRTVEAFFAHHSPLLETFAHDVTRSLAAGNTLMLCGNGGSACDAMHIAGEFVGRFKRERKGLSALALSADNGILTALGNDYGFERIFARQIEALARRGDLLIALSTSGRSPNILAAMEAARNAGMRIALFTGERGAAQAAEVDFGFVIPSADTAHIQECYMVALHALAEAVENALIAA